MWYGVPLLLGENAEFMIYIKGSYETTFVLLGAIPANQEQRHNKYASHADLRASEVQSFVFILTAAGPRCGK